MDAKVRIGCGRRNRLPSVGVLVRTAIVQRVGRFGSTSGLGRGDGPLGRKRSEVWNRFVMMALAEQSRRLLDAPSNRPHPEARRAAALAAKERPHVGQDGVGHVEGELERSKTEHADRETPGEPFGLVESPEHLGDGFPSKLHRAVGHQEMDRRVGVPDIEIRIERPECVRIVADRPFDEPRLARWTLSSSVDPAGNAAAHPAFAVEQEDGLGGYD
jgi:hypothetical protein